MIKTKKNFNLIFIFANFFALLFLIFSIKPNLNSVFAEHYHNFSFTKNNFSIIAKCLNDDCDISDISITLVAENSTFTNSYYNDFYIINKENFELLTNEIIEIYFEGYNNTIFEKSSTAPIDCGEYILTIKVNNIEISSNFCINKGNQINLDVFTENYAYTDTVSTPTIVGDIKDNATIEYYYTSINKNNNGILWENLTPVSLDVGTYYVYAVIKSTKNYNEFITNTKSFNILQKDISNAYVLLDKGLTFNGEIQYQGVKSVTVNGYPVTYNVIGNSVFDVKNYSLNIQGIGNFKGYTSKEFTIRKAFNTLTISAKDMFFGDTDINYFAESKYGTPTFSFAKKGSTDFVEERPTEIGSYTIKAEVIYSNCYDICDYADFSINKKPISIPKKSTNTYVYNGKTQTYKLTESAFYTIFGNIKIDSGNYNVVVKLNDKDNYIWEDGSNDDLVYLFTISKATIFKPSEPKDIYVYNGKEQTFKITSNSFYNVSGNIRKDVGVYNVIISLKDKNNYTWKDGTIIDLVYPFIIYQSSLEGSNSDGSKNENPTVWITKSSDYFHPYTKLIVDESISPNSDIIQLLKSNNIIKNEKNIAYYYNVYLKNLENYITLNGNSILKIKIPTNLINSKFSIYNIQNNNSIKKLDYEIGNQFITLTTNSLSSFVFILNEKPLTYIIVTCIIVLICLIITSCIITYFIIKKRKTRK